MNWKLWIKAAAIRCIKTIAQAESKYYNVLSSAAVSQVPCHAAVLIDSEGGFIDSRCYNHSE